LAPGLELVADGNRVSCPRSPTSVGRRPRAEWLRARGAMRAISRSRHACATPRLINSSPRQS